MMSTAQAVIAALSSHKIKSVGHNQYRCNSPLRAGSDGLNFSLTIEHDEAGAWFDHKEERGGSLYELAKLLNIQTPRSDIASTKRPYQGLDDYARAHGVEPIEFKRWKWKQVVYQNRVALEFPTETGKRWRFLDGDKPAFKSETGYKSCWYGLTREVGESVGDDLPLVICNGEPSVVSAHFYQVPAICVTAGEKGTIPSYLIEELKEIVGIVPIIVALDCDDKGRKSAAGMVATLQAAGFPARAVDLGLSDGGDVGDFCTLHGPGADKKLLQCAPLSDGSALAAPIPSRDYGLPKDKLLGHGRSWIMLHTDDLRFLPKVTWLLKPYIPSQGLIVLYGPSGTGKSFLALWFALQIAQEKSIIYMAYEGEWGYQSRVRAAQNHYHFGRGFNITLGQVDLMSDDDFVTFLDAAKKVKPSVVFIDTLARSMGDLDENSTQAMNTYVRRCNLLMQELNCSVVLVHHTGKAGSVERGSTVLRGAADVMIRLEDADERVLVENSKTKDGKPFPSFHIRLHPVDTGLADEFGMPLFTPVAVVSHEEDIPDTVLTKNQSAILSQIVLFDDEGMTYTEIARVVGDAVKPSSMNNALHSLKKKGYLKQESKGAAYVITETGKDALNGGKPWQPPTPQPAPDSPLAPSPKNRGKLPGMPAEKSAYHEAGL
jgi:hypothetical protein